MHLADRDLYIRVINEFKKSGSVKRTAENVGTTLVRAQRILITEGLWSSETSKKIGALHNKGLSVREIAEKLIISEKTVQAYLPYSRGVYGGNDRSYDSKKSENYRNRMSLAEQCQVNGFSYKEINIISDDELDKLRDELDEQIRDVLRSGNMREDTKKKIVLTKPVAFKLHMQLESNWLGDKEITILKKYGRVKESISRDIIVPANMTLHALHYAIQRAFGWENSHLHHFSLSENVFQILTGGTIFSNDEEDKIPDGYYKKWAELCGIYFRFPTDDFKDIYWDDDYEEGISFKSWLRKKYKGPYQYNGSWEHYRIANNVARKFMKDNPFLKLSIPFDEWMKLKEEGKLNETNMYRTINMKNLRINDLIGYFEGGMDELLERLPLNQIIQLNPVDNWKDKVRDIAELSAKQKDTVYNLPAIPVDNKLFYKYDYGDGWRVGICCIDVYYEKDKWDTMKENDIGGFFVAPVLDKDSLADKKIYNSNFERMDDDLAFKIATAHYKQLPLCVNADGLPVMDDVGGVRGYVDFLKTIHEKDREESEEYIAWARSMGWSGRMSKPENIL